MRLEKLKGDLQELFSCNWMVIKCKRGSAFFLFLFIFPIRNILLDRNWHLPFEGLPEGQRACLSPLLYKSIGWLAIIELWLQSKGTFIYKTRKNLMKIALPFVIDRIIRH
jgi:hypothetical protein